MTLARHRILAAACALAACTLGFAAQSGAQDRADLQYTELISRDMDGGVPNGPSTNGVISGDRRWARVIAFQSTASNIVRGDVTNRKVKNSSSARASRSREMAGASRSALSSDANAS
jgi:hypothetical protein